jgi:hypothetical protein
VLAPEVAAANAAAEAEAKANGLMPGEQPQKGVTLLGGLVDRKSKVGTACCAVMSSWAIPEPAHCTASRLGEPTTLDGMHQVTVNTSCKFDERLAACRAKPL